MRTSTFCRFSEPTAIPSEYTCTFVLHVLRLRDCRLAGPTKKSMERLFDEDERRLFVVDDSQTQEQRIASQTVPQLRP